MACRWGVLLALAALAGCGGDAPPEPELPISVDADRDSAAEPDDGPRTEPNLRLPPKPPDICWSSLDWLVRHQGPDGSWSAPGGGCTCGDGKGDPRLVGTTAMALLAMSHHWTDHRDRKYGRSVRAGLEFLLAVQDEKGVFGSREPPSWLLDQCLATLAVVEMYGDSKPGFLAPGARKGVDLLVAMRRRDGGWGGSSDGTGAPDPMATAWATLALEAGRNVGLVPSTDGQNGAGGGADEWTGAWMGGDRHPDDRAAMLLLVRAFDWDGTDAGDPSIQVLQESLVAARPGLAAPGQAVDPAWLFLANLGLRISSVKMPHGHDGPGWCGPCWKWGPRGSPRYRWSKGLPGFLEGRVCAQGCAAGSVDPVDAGPLGLGRPGATALHSMTEASFH